MKLAPGFDEIFAVMAAASVGEAAARVALPDEPQPEDLATRFAIALNLLLDDHAQRSTELKAQLETVQRQQRAIMELSTPLLEIRSRLLILPIIGSVDSDRARQINESLLQAIRLHRAKAIVVDITGLPVMDSDVAGYLMQSIKASRLMGAEVFLSGISSAVAQALVDLGEELATVRTFGNLKAALDEAEMVIGNKR